MFIVVFIVYHSITNVQKETSQKKTVFFPVKTSWGFYENLQLLKYHLIYWTEAATQRWGFTPPVFPPVLGRSKFVFRAWGVGDREGSVGEWLFFFFGLMIWTMDRYDIIIWYAKEFGVQFGIDMQIPKVENMQSKWQNKQKECHQSKANTTKLSLLKKRSARLITLFAGHGGIWFSYI